MISLIHAYLENRETFMENFIDQEEGFKKVEKPIWKWKKPEEQGEQSLYEHNDHIAKERNIRKDKPNTIGVLSCFQS